MIIRIRNSQKRQRLPERAIRKKLETLLERLRFSDAEVSVLFSGDRMMRTLNWRYRGKDRTTDVLSFSFREGAFPSIQPELLGDIVISIPQARRQAIKAGHSLERELDILLVHGLLHLVGYDHERGGAEAERMRRKEKVLLRELERDETKELASER